MPGDQQQLGRKTEQMLRTFLADQFKVQTRFEHREQSVYALVIAKGGPKLKPSVDFLVIDHAERPEQN
jgi:uncharacterized protein (TIGR03435 family)